MASEGMLISIKRLLDIASEMDHLLSENSTLGEHRSFLVRLGDALDAGESARLQKEAEASFEAKVNEAVGIILQLQETFELYGVSIKNEHLGRFIDSSNGSYNEVASLIRQVAAYLRSKALQLP